MKRLIIINGAPGAGKTTVCRKLYRKMERSVWLDGDWCWMINPFRVTEENKKMVEENIIFLLSNYIKNSSVETIIFNWVIPHDKLMNRTIQKLPLAYVDKIYKFTLVSSEAVLRKRLEKDGRSENRIDRSVEGMASFYQMDTQKIDTSHMSVEQTVEYMKGLIESDKRRG